ncbi:FAD-dependent monooxygenase OpS4 [Pseudocercospora fuligena]|uniref:FAD-dependent monooxygenase OpS4 n=1 Tax=Pseudocercospora fuligena TaxID=685502 RepID=A0A8H6RWY1_9PEZI|nr:FAD-dependent monooxygenase OpS4 [Pseudocercospora fuligena]
MEYYHDTWKLEAQPEKQLNVLIVGAGIAGLATAIGLRQSGHNVKVLEQVHEIAEVGAGIQMAPNNMRILGRMGVLPEIVKQCNFMKQNSLRRWQDNSELGTAPLMPAIADKFGAPLGVIHRGDLQRILLQAAKDSGAEILTNHKVTKVDENFEGRVQLVDGSWVEGDLVIAADGIKSHIRAQIADHHNHKDHATPTGDSAYRILIPKEKMEHDENALRLLNKDVGMRWMGPGGHIMAYPVKNNTVYNMVLLHPQKKNGSEAEAETESWTRKGSKSEMLSFYKSWCPEVRNLLSYVPEGEVMEWTLNSHSPLPSWIENKVVLIGDASHPMLPYVAQGAAQAIEDAGVLQCVLAKSSTNIPLALGVFASVRKARAEAVQGSANTTRKALHLDDGAEQEERDRKIREASEGKGENPDMWADTTFQSFMWGVDVMQDTIVRWPEHKARAEGTHLHAVAAVGY